MKIVTGTQAELDAAIQNEVNSIAAEQTQLRDLAVRSRLLFLDFDGVLNHGEFFSARGMKRRDEREEFDRACVQRLNRLLRESGALVVVSSSWRIGRSVDDLRRLLADYGFDGTIIGKTPDRYTASITSRLAMGKQRGDEIRAWLDDLPEPTHRFVVLDDDSDMDAVRPHFVKTQFHEGGLTDAKVKEALELFKRLDRGDANAVRR